MNWSSLAEFVAMGGYAAYVWGSCGVTLAALAMESILVRRRLRRARHAVAEGGRSA